MLVLIDESLPKRIRREMPGFEVLTVPQRGWSKTKNGALLRLAEAAGFDAQNAWASDFQALVCGRPRSRGILRTMDPKQIVHSDPDILGGTPVFVGTRVPVDALIDFLEGGETIEYFLENYPGVSREQVFAFLEEASRALLAKIA